MSPFRHCIAVWYFALLGAAIPAWVNAGSFPPGDTTDQQLVVARAGVLQATMNKEHPRLLLRQNDIPAFRTFVEALSASESRLLWPPLHSLLPEQPLAVKNGTTEGSVAWREGYQVANDAGNMALRHAFAWLASGDARYGREAARWLMHLASWKIDQGFYRTNDELFIQHLRPMIFAYDWAWSALTPEERSVVGKAIETRLTILAANIQPKFSLTTPTSPDNSLSHPMRFISTLGQGGVALFHEAAAAPAWVAWTYEYYLRQFPVWGGDAGGWSEGLAYWSTGITQHLRFLECMQLLGFDEALRRPFFRNTAYFAMYGLMPNGGSSFGDLTNIITPSPSVALLIEKLGLLQGDPYPITWANNLKVRPLSYFGYYEYSPIDAILHQFRRSQTEIEPKKLADLAQSRYFDDVGVVSMHSDLGDPNNDIMLGFRSSPQGSASHSFADQNSFVVNAFGEPLAISSGYREYYDSPHHKGWTRTTAAKNAVLFGGEGQTIKDATAIGRITRFRQGKTFSFATGDAVRAYGGRATQALRHIFFVGRRYFVVFDEVAAPKPLQYEWLLHAREPMQVDENAGRVTQAKGNARLAVQFLEPEPSALTFHQTDAFDPPIARGYEKKMPNEWHVAGETRAPQQRANFLTTLFPYRATSLKTDSRAAESQSKPNIPDMLRLPTLSGFALQAAWPGAEGNEAVRSEIVLIAREEEKRVILASSASSWRLEGLAASMRTERESTALSFVDATQLHTPEFAFDSGEPLCGEGALNRGRFELSVTAANDTRIALTLPFRVARMSLNGSAQQVTSQNGKVIVPLPAGQNTVVVEASR